MIKSMTAYGRFSKQTPFGRFVIEIHSVNRKMLDVAVYFPKELLRFEVEVRKWIMAEVERGQVTVRITLQHEGIDERVYAQTLKQLQVVKTSWDQIALKLGLDPKKEIDLRFLVDQMQIVSPVQEEKEEALLREPLQEAVKGALHELMKMKVQEGKALLTDMVGRLKTIQQTLVVIEGKKEGLLNRYRQRIRERLQEVGPLVPEVEEKIHREVALLAERADVTEEIVRAHSHLQQFQAHVDTADRAVGRTLDFLAQEMNREVNTLATKSLDTEVSLLVVQIKSELEKIREQVQNIE